MVEKINSNQEDKIDRAHADLEKDFDRVKKALWDVSKDVQGKATEFVTHSYEDIKNASHKKADDVSDYIRENPLKTVGLALLTGFIVGRFMR